MIRTNSKNRLNGQRGFTLIDVIIVILLIFLIYFIMLNARDKYNRYIVNSTAARFMINLDKCKNLAALANDKAQIIFRPVDGPYTSYHISAEGQETQEFTLPGEVYIINTNGFIRNHTLLIDSTGQFFNDKSQLIENPNPALITVISNATDGIRVIRIDPKTLKIDMD